MDVLRNHGALPPIFNSYMVFSVSNMRLERFRSLAYAALIAGEDVEPFFQRHSHCQGPDDAVDEPQLHYDSQHDGLTARRAALVAVEKCAQST